MSQPQEFYPVQQPWHPSPGSPYVQQQQQPPQQQPGQRKSPKRQRPQEQGRHLKFPRLQRTNSCTWFIAVFCTILWVLIILGGLAILIVYLVFRPQSPRFDIQNAGLNAAYLDTGILLNADLTLLANFSNSNKKVSVDFSYISINLYYGNTLIATGAVDPFSETRRESKLVNIHMVTSEVRIPVIDIMKLRKQLQENKVPFVVKGFFRTRSKFGGFLRYSYWLHGQCTLVLTGPPSGVLVSRKCRTKR